MNSDVSIGDEFIVLATVQLFLLFLSTSSITKDLLSLTCATNLTISGRNCVAYSSVLQLRSEGNHLFLASESIHRSNFLQHSSTSQTVLVFL